MICTFTAGVLLAMALFASGASAAVGSISGTVTKFGTATPIEKVEVCAMTVSESEEKCAQTDADGEYTVELGPGEYKVEFWGEGVGYATQYYSDKDTWEAAAKIPLGDGETLTGVDGHLHVQAKIKGRVVDAQSESVLKGVVVCAQLGNDAIDCAQSDSSGKYELNGLPPGEYLVYFYPFDGDHLLQYYDETQNFDDATLVTVAEGETKEGIDGALVHGAVISGRVTSLKTGLPLEEIMVCVDDAASGEARGYEFTEAEGKYTLPPLEAGSYKVEFNEGCGEGIAVDGGYLGQFWNGVATLAEAEVITVAPGEKRTEIDAALASVEPPPPPPAEEKHETPPAGGGEPTKPAAQLKCKKGFVKKKVRGKTRCVKKHHHRKHKKHRR
jgi:hypothetical protein